MHQCSKCNERLFNYGPGVMTCKNGHRYSVGDVEPVSDRTGRGLKAVAALAVVADLLSAAALVVHLVS